MSPTLKNYDLICFQLRNNLYSQLQNPLKKEINRLSSDIKKLIFSREKIKAQTAEMLGQVFNLRIKALKWLSADINFDYSGMLNDVIPKIEELKSNKRLEILADNILFALRCNQRVVDSIINSTEFTSASFSSNLDQLPDITYPQFVASLAFANLDAETAQKIVDWTNASLHIEFVLVATDVIQVEKLKPSDRTINELAFLVGDAAQEYYALATELGILKTRSANRSTSSFSFENSFVKEQQQMADLGLGDFALNLPN
jgi:hypothetical protein